MKTTYKPDKKSKRSQKSVKRDRPPSYSYVSPAKSVRSSCTMRTQRTNRSTRKMRNFNESMTYSNYQHQPISEFPFAQTNHLLDPYHHHATLPRGDYQTLSQTMPVHNIGPESHYYTVQRTSTSRRQNKKREDYLY